MYSVNSKSSEVRTNFRCVRFHWSLVLIVTELANAFPLFFEEKPLDFMELTKFVCTDLSQSRQVTTEMFGQHPDSSRFVSALVWTKLLSSIFTDEQKKQILLAWREKFYLKTQKREKLLVTRTKPSPWIWTFQSWSKVFVLEFRVSGQSASIPKESFKI